MAKEEKPISTEYPKSLYKDGDRNSTHTVVHDEADERSVRAIGFKMIDKKNDAAAVERLAAPEVVEESAPEPATKKVKK